MRFQKGYIYHIYNQGNNRRKIFFNRENYLFFLRKIRIFVKPYTDILAWCLMPNHFHLMVLVKELELPVGPPGIGMDSSRSIGGDSLRSIGVVSNNTDASAKAYTNSDTNTNANTPHAKQSEKTRSFNHSIGIMLRSYSQAVNKQQKFTGKLIREKTNAECVNCPELQKPSFYTANGTTNFAITNPEYQYPQICFEYIHNNPVKARLVKNPEAWEFSSAADYAGLRNGTLINKETAYKYIIFPKPGK